MKSSRLFYETTPFRKNLTRFAPLWALYTILLMLVMFIVTGSSSYYDTFANGIMDGLVMAFSAVNIGYAGICALCLFGDLFNTKMCYSIHALPQRREVLLLSNLLAGLLFSLVPNLLASLYLMIALENYWFLSLYWLLAVTLQFIFFFGIGIFSVMLTGNRWGAMVVYGLLNFLSLLAYLTVQTLYIPWLEGVVLCYNGFSLLSPCVHLFTLDYFAYTTERIPSYGYMGSPGTRTFYHFAGLGDGWVYLACLGLVGLAAMGISVLLYRRRHLESAGDFAAFPRIKQVMSVVMTLCVTAVFAMIAWLFDEETSYFWTLIGLAAGHFFGLMLLERQVKVFRKNTVITFAVLAVLVFLSFSAAKNDWLGITRYVPDADRVKSVTISNYNTSNYYHSSSAIDITLTDAADVEKIITAHEDILAQNDTPGLTHTVTITYTLKSGRVVTRYYHAPASGTNYAILSGYFNNADNLLGLNQMSYEELLSGMEYMHYQYTELPPVLYEKVLSALADACDRGYVSMEYISNGMSIGFYSAPSTAEPLDRELYISSAATEFLDWMNSPEVVLGFADWDAFLARLQNVYAVGVDVPANQVKGLMEALLQDAQAGNLETEKATEDALAYISWWSWESGYGIYREIAVTKLATNTLQWLQENGYLE